MIDIQKYTDEYLSALELGKALAEMSNMDQQSAYRYANNRLKTKMENECLSDEEKAIITKNVVNLTV